MSQITDEIRKSFKAGDDIRDEGLTTPSDIVRFDDIFYGENRDWQKLDVYRPAESGDRKLPVIVSVHGGAWTYGDKERYQFYCMNLAQRGFAVVNFTYRLMPEFKFPAQLEDTNLVFAWILENAEKYNLDVKNIFALGDSAGGHLLCLYTAICTNAGYARNYSFSVPKNLALKAVALNCGVYTRKKGESEQDDLLMAELLPGGGTAEEYELISGVNHVTSGFVPAFVMTANQDFLKNQAPVLVSRLMEVNVPFTFRFYGTDENPLGHVFHCDIKSAAAKLCNDEECEFFSKYID